MKQSIRVADRQSPLVILALLGLVLVSGVEGTAHVAGSLDGPPSVPAEPESTASGETQPPPKPDAVPPSPEGAGAAPAAVPLPAESVPPSEPQDVLRELTRLRRALMADPQHAETRRRLALLLYQMGDLDGAVDEYRTLLAKHPELDEARAQLAVVLMAKQEWRSADKELQESLRLHPDSADALVAMGTLRYTRGDLPAAVTAYQRAAALRPDSPDVQYHLGLLLKLTKRDREAAAAFKLAAEKGLPRAQWFLGTAYVQGQGIEKDPAVGLLWWLRASESGLPQAGESLARWRQAATGTVRKPAAERQAAGRALQEARERLRRDVLGGAPAGEEADAGAVLLSTGRPEEAVPVLIEEAWLLSPDAPTTLEKLYVQGVDGRLAPYDARILRFFIAAAAEGLVDSRQALARIYENGWGVPPDHEKARALTKRLSGAHVR